ncbi:putative polysaccharide export protein [Pseudovirgaria hyperparasitica]|uniref:Putative polysaccharide export protein n=1 Tax=Pseudovirgaria hyperparasitica TaxID=470096 RepID=A0A6A6W8D4_9PEZI|nr:putative polysaccharide export protein [Pseudovirgaria hyperparasitica]KAF2758913.1 putative polysaccharide export protein [Pseudovirgaria hyperparasitica]
MLSSRAYYGNRRSRARLIRGILLIFFLWTFFDLIRVHRNLVRHHEEVPHTLATPNSKVFLTSIHWNNEKVLREYWNNAVVNLTEAIGVDNVYISIYESGSWDDSKGALRDLETRLDDLGARHTIVMNATTHKDENRQKPGSSGWIKDSSGKQRLRRIPYLSEQRNRALQPLYDLAEETGEQFDLVIHMNDVVFSTDDIFRLMQTNGGEYAAACALDFSKPPNFYDTFALRDSDGYETLMQTWPYFRSSASRNALKHNVPVPVSSCWNGIVVMDASPFYRTNNPLRFRGITDTLANFHVEGSECCLIHADNPLSVTKGVWLNPAVRVGYNGPAYKAVHRNGGDDWLSSFDIVVGLWINRIKRRATFTWMQNWRISRRVATWKSLSKGNEEKGAFCLINEMQVLADNGWAHI